MNHNTISVVGGAYGEECAFPRVKVFRGSGGRASSFLASVGCDVTFHTRVGAELHEHFMSIARALNYSLEARDKPQDIWFRYRHPLGKPDIINSSQEDCIDNTWVVNGENLLVFGMLEGRPKVKAKKAVFDPQDGSNAQTFESNGSVADSLAIVLSYSEGVAITNEKKPSKMAEYLLQNSPNAEVVIVKCGPQGALVATHSSSSWISSFPTSKVYKVGSGDIFTAAFAYMWMQRQQDPLKAAWFASLATAQYVETTVDRLTPSQLEELEEKAQLQIEKPVLSQPNVIPNTQVYLAGPFFTSAQQWRIDEARESLKDMGFSVFSPIHDVGPGGAKDVAPADIEAINTSGLMLAIMDDLDPGTIFEIGYARAKDIPVVVVAECVTEKDLTMILGSGCDVTDDFTTGIYAACWHLMKNV
jgi:nucleoside 2-deoxyribosyltransferase